MKKYGLFGLVSLLPYSLGIGLTGFSAASLAQVTTKAPICTAPPTCAAGTSLQGQPDGSVACKACTPPTVVYPICTMSYTWNARPSNAGLYALVGLGFGAAGGYANHWYSGPDLSMAYFTPAGQSKIWTLDVVATPANVANYGLKVNGTSCTSETDLPTVYMHMSGKGTVYTYATIASGQEPPVTPWPYFVNTADPMVAAYIKCVQTMPSYPNVYVNGQWSHNVTVCPPPYYLG